MKELLKGFIAAKREGVLDLLVVTLVPGGPKLGVGLVVNETHEHLNGYKPIQLTHSRIYPCARASSTPARSAANIR